MADLMMSGHGLTGDRSSKWSLPLRSSSLPRRCGGTPPVVRRCTPVPFPAGDGIRRVELTNRPLVYNPPPYHGIRTLFTNNGYDLARRASTVDDSELFANNPEIERLKMDELDSKEPTPIRKVSQAVLSGIGQLLTSDTIRKTASTIFTSAARIGSHIVTKGMEVATHILREMEYEDAEILVKEDEVKARGFGIKVQGEELLLQSIHFEETELKVRIELGSKLTSFVPSPPFWNDDNILMLTFGSSTVHVVTPPGLNLDDIKWETSDSGILTIYLQCN